jgi:hypothetical protein
MSQGLPLHCARKMQQKLMLVEVVGTAFPPPKVLEVIELYNPRGSKLMLHSLHSCEEQNKPRVCLDIFLY